jgi:phage gp29-like protein
MTTIYDHRGEPVRITKLTKEAAAPSLSGVRSVWHDSVAFGLTPQRLAQIVASVDAGDANDYLTLAEEMEERDLHYQSVLGTRKSAVAGLSLVVESYSDDDKDVEQADFVSDILGDDGVKPMIKALLDALGKSYSVCEIMWDRSGKRWEPAGYEWRDPRFFRFDRETGQKLRMLDESNQAEGVPLVAYKFIQHRPSIKMGLPIRGGLARLALVAFMCKGYALKDWLAFCEVFGMPIRIGKYGPGATAEQKSKLLSAVANIGIDASAIIPDSMMIDLVEPKSTSGGERLFQGLADWLDSQVSKGVLGQTMTTDDGSSMAQAEVHDRVRQDIKTDDAEQLAATIRRDLVKPLIDLNFGERSRREYPKVRLVHEESEDLVMLSKALPPFIDRGLRIESSVIRDKFGLPEPDDGAEVLGRQVAPAKAKQDATAEEEETEEDQDQEQEVVDDAALNREQRAFALQLAHRAAKGETLSEWEQTFVALMREDDDEVGRLARRAASDWRKTMGPVVDPLVELASSATSFDEYLSKANELLEGADRTALVQSIASFTFRTRGLGDATDEVV